MSIRKRRFDGSGLNVPKTKSHLILNTEACPSLSKLENRSLIQKYSKQDPRRPGRRTEFYAAQSKNDRHIIHTAEAMGTDGDGAFDFAIGIRNKRTNETVFQPAVLLNFRTKFATDPEVFLGKKAAKSHDIRELNADRKDETDSGSYKNRRNILLERFGGGKKLSALLKSTAKDNAGKIAEETMMLGLVKGIKNDDSFVMKTEADPNDQSTSSSIGSGTDTPSSSRNSMIAVTPEPKKANTGESQLIPPHNANAKTAEEVFSIEHFLTAEDLEKIRSDAQELLLKTRQELVDAGMVDIAFFHLFNGMPAETKDPADETSRLNRASLVLWLDVLIQTARSIGTHQRKKKQELELEQWSLGMGISVTALRDMGTILGCTSSSTGPAFSRKTRIKLVGPPGNAHVAEMKAKLMKRFKAPRNR